MLPRRQRVVKDRDFTRIYKKGRFCGVGAIALKSLKNNKKYPRFAFLVGTKVSKKAVERNKIKRRLREITRELLLEIKPGFDVVLYTKPGVEKMNFEELQKKTTKLYKKAKLL